MAAAQNVVDLLLSLPARISRFPFIWAERTPSAIAYIEGDRTWTYRDLAAAVAEAAAWLKAKGLRPGDRLLLVNENCVQALILLLAAQELDAWPVPVNARLAAAELDAIEAHCEPRLALYTSACSAEAAAHARRKGAAREEAGALGSLDVGPLRASAVAEPTDPSAARQVAALLYTTGTTGRPKGVMLSHRNLLYNAAVGAQVRQIKSGDRLYGSLPISHVYGLASMALMTVYAGASARIVSRYSPEDLLAGLESGGVTVLQGVSAMYTHLLEHLKANPKARLVQRLRYIQTGGSPLDPGLKEKVESLFGLPLHNSYGLTESSPTLIMTRIEAPRRDTSVGEALPGVSVKRLGPEGREAAAGEPGELAAQGPNVMLGYYKDPQATSEALKEGWLRTGDLAVQLPDGAYQIVGRAKEVIIRSGFNVYPPEVEAALSAHPAVSQCAVVGRALKDGNEEPVAFVVFLPQKTVEDDALNVFLADRLAPYKRPARYVALPSLPASPTGKILRQRLSELAQDLQ